MSNFIAGEGACPACRQYGENCKCIQVATEFAQLMLKTMEEELPKQAEKHAAAVAALRAAWETYQVWQDGMADSDEFLDWAAEEALTWEIDNG